MLYYGMKTIDKTKERPFIGRYSILKQKVLIHDIESDDPTYVMYSVEDAKCKFDANIYLQCLESGEVITMGKTIAEPCWQY